jgi:hypothetical protein
MKTTVGELKKVIKEATRRGNLEGAVAAAIRGAATTADMNEYIIPNIENSRPPIDMEGADEEAVFQNRKVQQACRYLVSTIIDRLIGNRY